MEQAKIVSIESAQQPRRRRRVPVPATVFTGRPEPPFVLFDAEGQRATLGAARTVYVSPADLQSLDAYVRAQLRALRADPAIDRADQAWVLQRALLDEARHALALRDGYSQRGLHAVAAEIAAFALAGNGDLRFLDSDGEGRTAVEAVNRAQFAVALAAANGLRDSSALEFLLVAAIYADSGRHVLPPKLLSAQAQPTPEHERLRRGHPERSVTLLRRAGVRSDLAERAILGHHERWDGGGYPRGLRGSQNPIEGRVLAVADAFAIDTSSGRDAFEALREMTADRGRFDPQLLRRFVPLAGAVMRQLRRAARGE